MTYWDILEPKRSQLYPLGKPQALKAEIQKLPYLPDEFEKLKESELNSNELVGLEVEAFNAMDGVFKDSNGKYTIKGDANQKLAVELLTSKEYFDAKARIMLPIDAFLHSLSKRTTESLSHQMKIVESIFKRIVFLISSGILLLIFTAI